MADEIVYRYCLTCRKKYRSTGVAGQTCPKCGGLLADTPTGVTKPVSGPKPKPAVAPPPAPRSMDVPTPNVAPQVESTTEVVSAPAEKSVSTDKGEWSCKPLDVILCFLHNLLTGIPILGLIWCGISVFANPLKGRVSKGTVVAGLISNAISTVLLILMYTAFK